MIMVAAQLHLSPSISPPNTPRAHTHLHTCSNFKLLKVTDGDRPGEKYAQLQYSLLDKRTPHLDESGKKIKRVLIENGRFLQVCVPGWTRLHTCTCQGPASAAGCAPALRRDPAFWSPCKLFGGLTVGSPCLPLPAPRRLTAGSGRWRTTGLWMCPAPL